jgi:hypothetical protein
MAKKAGKGRFREILWGYAGNQNSAGLSRGRVGGAREIVLAYANVVRHLMFDVPPSPYYEEYQGVVGRSGMKLTREYPSEY